MNRNSTSGIIGAAKILLTKSVLLLIAMLFIGSAYAEDINCPDPSSIKNYVHKPGPNEGTPIGPDGKPLILVDTNIIGTQWTLSWDGDSPPKLDEYSNPELKSVEVVLSNSTYLKSAKCEYRDASNNSPSLFLEMTHHGWISGASKDGLGYTYYRGELTSPRKWKPFTKKDKSHENCEAGSDNVCKFEFFCPDFATNMCDATPNKRENFVGFKWAEQRQTNGYWDEAFYWCNNTGWSRCVGNWSANNTTWRNYMSEIQKYQYSEAPRNICMYGSNSVFASGCSVVPAKKYCKDIRCTEEINDINTIVGGVKDKATGKGVGEMDVYLGMCWSSGAWMNKQYSYELNYYGDPDDKSKPNNCKKYDSNGTTRIPLDKLIPTDPWPDYTNIPEVPKMQ